jgi:lipopolysaccharide heptosyltransferase II
MKITTLKLIDNLIGSVLVACLPATRGTGVAEPQSFLVIRPGGIGDAVLLVPALLAIRERFPDAEITILAERRNSEAFSLAPTVDKLLLYDTSSELFKALSGRYDVVIDTEQWHRLSAVVARMTRGAVSIGFATNGRKALFTHKVPYSQDSYEAWSFFDLLKPLGIEPPEALPVPFLVVPDEAQRRAAELLATSRNPNFVALFPGASIPERKWGHNKFRQLASRLALYGLSVVVVGGKEDYDEGHFIARACGGITLAGETTLAETAAVIARSGAVVSGDSGILHIAVGLAVPTVSLFGPGIEAKWGPRGERDVVINKKLPCSPCTRFGTTPRCRTQASCLGEITVDEVIDALEKVYREPAQH